MNRNIFSLVGVALILLSGSASAITITECDKLKNEVLILIGLNKAVKPDYGSQLYDAIKIAQKNSNYQCLVVSVASLYGVEKTLNKKISASISRFVNGYGPADIKILASDRYFQEAKGYIGLNDIDKKEFTYDSPLHEALYKLDFKLAMKLIMDGADINSKGNEGFKPLFVAAGAGNVEIIKIIISKGIEPDQVAPNGRTPLTQSSFHNRVEAINYLVKSGANPNSKDKAGGSPLLFSVMRGHIEATKALLQNGAQVDISDSSGITPLMMAALKKNISIVKILLNNKANLRATDNKGNSALDYARSYGNSEIAGYLVKVASRSKKNTIK